LRRDGLGIDFACDDARRARVEPVVDFLLREEWAQARYAPRLGEQIAYVDHMTGGAQQSLLTRMFGASRIFIEDHLGHCVLALVRDDDQGRHSHSLAHFGAARYAWKLFCLKEGRAA
jgi:hypothetical protein